MSNKEIKVTKRNGTKETFDADKINKIVSWATEGISDTNPSDVAMRANVYITNDISTKEVHQSLIDAAIDLIDEDNTNYSKVAARLFLYQLRKEVWGSKNPPTLFDQIKNNVEKGFYTPELLDLYSKEEINKIGELVNHNRDDFFGIGGLTQLAEKYLVQNRSTGEILETPQFAFVLIAMTLFGHEKSNRISLIKKYYDALSKFKINAPTPIMAGARTRTKSYSSCCLIEVADTKESLFANITAAGLATCDKYGIGIDLGKLRPINAPIKGGETLHSGAISWLKIFQDTIAACQQGGARRGAGTVSFPIFHPEIMTILELKNNQGTHENRVPHLDYTISISKLFWSRYIRKEKISLFSSQDAPDLYDNFGLPHFDELYVAYEESTTPRVEIDSTELFSTLFIERIETGRIYILNADEANNNSPWVERVGTSNLCVEVLQTLKPQRFTNDPEAEIGVCVLGATNMLNVKDDKEHEELCYLLVRSLDNLIDIQEYKIKAAENFAKNKRSLGIGVTNMSAWLAEKGLNQNSPESPQLISDFMEKQQYFLLKASCSIAKEKGAAPNYEFSKYSLGLMPTDMYNKNVDEFLVPNKLDWLSLKEDIQQYGIRNMTLSAVMPVESSSVVQNSTNGVEPITSLVTKKTSTTKTAIVVAPNAKKWKKYYLKKEDIKNDNSGIIKCSAAVVKWLDMALSFNLYYDSSQFPDGNLPLSLVVKDHLMATKYGMKTFYYLNSKKKKDGSANQDLEIENNSCLGGSCTL